MSKLVAQTQPGLNMGSLNPTRARKKVARPSPNYQLLFLALLGVIKKNPKHFYPLILAFCVITQS